MRVDDEQVHGVRADVEHSEAHARTVPGSDPGVVGYADRWT